MIRFLLPFVFSSVGLAALMFFERGGLTSGDASLSLLFGIFGTGMLLFPLYAFVDLLRLRLRWPAWTICLLVAGFCASLATLMWFGLHDYESGFQSPLDALVSSAAIFLSSLVFGVPYTASYYVPKLGNFTQLS